MYKVHVQSCYQFIFKLNVLNIFKILYALLKHKYFIQV